jgi:hypothetical protein
VSHDGGCVAERRSSGCELHPEVRRRDEPESASLERSARTPSVRSADWETLRDRGHRLIAVDRWELERVVGSPPDPISKYVAHFITTQRRINKLGEAAVSAARRGDDVTAQRLSQRSRALTRTQDLDARMIGATKCLPMSGAR